MDVERLLISKVIAEKDLQPVADAGITPKFFLDPKNRAVFETLLGHKRDYDVVPTLAVMRADFPDYKFVKVDEAYDYLINKIREKHKLSLIEQGVAAAIDRYDEADADGAVHALSQTLTKIGAEIPTTRDTDLTQTGMERYARYLSYKDMPDGLRGVPSGFTTIDRATLGFQKKQLVTFVGPPKAGKSTIMLLCLMAAHLYGLRPLLIGFEMSNEEQEERFDAIRAGISHARLRAGTLKKSEWEKLERMLRQLESMPPLIFTSDSSSTTTLTGVAAKIDTYKPDIVFVDGVYMMDDENGEAKGSPQALTNLTRGFKRMAMNKDLPIAVSTQALSYKISKKQGITPDSIGYSSSFAQDSDVVVGVNGTEDEQINEVSIVIARNAPKLRTYIQWEWETGTFEELNGNPFEEGFGGTDDDGSSW